MIDKQVPVGTWYTLEVCLFSLKIDLVQWSMIDKQVPIGTWYYTRSLLVFIDKIYCSIPSGGFVLQVRASILLRGWSGEEL